MTVAFEIKTIDRDTLEVIEQGTYTSATAARALLKMKWRYHFDDVEQDRAEAQFEAVYEKVCPDVWEESVAELAPNEEVAIPFVFSSFTQNYVVTVILRNDSAVMANVV